MPSGKSGPIAEAFVQLRVDASKLDDETKTAVNRAFNRVDEAAHTAGTSAGKKLHTGMQSGVKGIDEDMHKAARDMLTNLNRIADGGTKAGDQVHKGMDEATAAAKKVGTAAQESETHLGKMGSGLKKALVGGGALLALGLFVNKLKEWTAAGQEAAANERVTAALIKTTGGIANISAPQLDAYISKLSVLTGTEDDIIRAGANILLSFRNVRNEMGAGNDIYNRAITDAMDLATVMKKDLNGSLLQVGKALQDPTKGYSRLQRAGVSFTESQVNQIKTLQASGNLLGAQKIILQELEHEFGGAAAAAADPMKRLAAAWQQLKESMGKGVIAGFGPALTALGPIFLELQRPLEALGQTLGVLMGELGKVAAPLLQSLSPIFRALNPLISDLGRLLLPVARLFGDLALTVLPPFMRILDVIVKVATPFVNLFADLLTPVLKALAPVFDAIAKAAERLQPAFDKIAAALEPIAQKLADAFVKIIDKLLPHLPELTDSFVKLAIAMADLLVALTPLLPPLISMFTFLMEKVGVPSILVIADAVTAVADALAYLVNMSATGWDAITRGFEGFVVKEGGWSKILSDLADGINGVSDRLTTAKGWRTTLTDMGLGFEFFWKRIDSPGGKEAIKLWGQHIAENVFVAGDQMAQAMKQTGEATAEAFYLAISRNWRKVTDWLFLLPANILKATWDLPSTLRLRGDQMVGGFLIGATFKWFDVAKWLMGRAMSVHAHIGEFINTLYGKGIDLIKGFLRGAVAKYGEMEHWLKGLAGRIIGAVGDASSWLRIRGLQVIAGFLNGMQTNWAGVGIWLASVSGSIWNFFAALPGQMLQLGMSIIGQLMWGIQQLVPALLLQVKGIADGIANWLSHPIHSSPPLAAINELGQGYIHALIAGMDEAQPKLDKRFLALSGGPTPGFGPQGGAMLVQVGPGAVVINVTGADVKQSTAAGKAAADAFTVTLAQRRVRFAVRST